MSGDDRDMDEILDEIRETVAGENGKREARRPPMIGLTAGVFSALPFFIMAKIWGRILTGWLIGSSEKDLLPFLFLMIFLIHVENIFRQPKGRGEWALVLVTLFLATSASTTTFAIVNWLLMVAAPELNEYLESPIIVLSAVGVLTATLWAMRYVTRDRNLILPREEHISDGDVA